MTVTDDLLDVSILTNRLVLEHYYARTFKKMQNIYFYTGLSSNVETKHITAMFILLLI
jgi:hypothetical protein